MSTLLAKITNSVVEYSENLLTPFCTFDKTHTWNIISGGANGIVSNSSVRKFEGSKSLRVDFTGVGQLVFSSGSTEMNFTAPKDGIYILSSRFFRELTATGDVSFEFTLFKNAIPFLEINENFNTETFELGKWNNFAQSFELEEGDVLSFVLKIGSSITGNHIYIDGLKLELDDRNLGIPSVYSRPYENNVDYLIRTLNDANSTQIDEIKTILGIV